MAPLRSTGRRRTVHFAEDQNITRLLERESCYKPEDQWCSQDDFEDTKRRMKRKAQEWKMKGYGVLLRDTFGNPHPTVQRNINAFAQLGDRDCARGMERAVSSNLDQKVGNMKCRCIKTVLSHQRIMKKDGKLSADDMLEELAVVSKMQSRPSVQFARRLGKADELALRNDDVSTAHKLVEELNRLSERQKPQRKAPLGINAAPRNRRSPRSARIA